MVRTLATDFFYIKKTGLCCYNYLEVMRACHETVPLVLLLLFVMLYISVMNCFSL
jgi:hypothetical protein